MREGCAGTVSGEQPPRKQVLKDSLVRENGRQGVGGGLSRRRKTARHGRGRGREAVRGVLEGPQKGATAKAAQLPSFFFAKVQRQKIASQHKPPCTAHSFPPAFSHCSQKPPTQILVWERVLKAGVTWERRLSHPSTSLGLQLRAGRLQA